MVPENRIEEFVEELFGYIEKHITGTFSGNIWDADGGNFKSGAPKIKDLLELLLQPSFIVGFRVLVLFASAGFHDPNLHQRRFLVRLGS